MMTIAALSCVAATPMTEILPGRPTDQVTWETLERFCKTNARELKGPVKGIIVEHPCLGQQDRNYCSKSVMDRATREGVVYLHVWAHPWSWMNDAQVALTDRLVDVLSGHFELGLSAKVVSYGRSMGAHGALTYPQFSRKNVVAVVANCPPCDLAFHYGERDDLPRTLVSAYANELDFAQAIRRHSPLASVESYRDIPYFIYQADADSSVNKEMHADRFVAAAAKRAMGPLKLTYVVGKRYGHCQLGELEERQMLDALFAPFVDAQ